ncbi:S41 family peptidase [Chitinophaga japonensis]|uniref:Peptidase S41-like protein n=1 Tax=Chitinophaga japonensis TaxID=104662 RepID=A0A562T3I6_CHIJA|nr:S41 family peptidase [Chitinophaga japonensis]TWI87953.1 peptidase S41-like protein [Chitinophaga japonensis]
MKQDFLRKGIPMIVVSLLCSSIFFSCKKDAQDDGNNNNNGGGGNTTAKTDEDSLKYLMYRLMQVTYADGGRNADAGLPTYYWYGQVPALDPFSSTYSTAENLLSTMMTFPEENGTRLDRYSFLDRTGSLANKLQNGVIEKTSGTTGSFGLEVTYALDQDNNTHLMVLYTDKNSPAGQQGVQRGWEITAINGDDNVAYDGESGANTTKVTNAVYSSASTTFTFKKTDNTTATLTLDAGSYNVNPILFDTVYNVGGKQVGYFAFYTFSSITNSDGGATATKQLLDQLFGKFKSAGIRELIVDLRYNTGGAVSTAQYLCNAIAPSSAQGKIMYYYTYNDKLTQNLAATGLPASISFGTTGGLQLDHVFFVTGNQTASASELTLNNLKPYMSVKLVGNTTYGKPVGFFSYTISTYDAAGTEKYLADLYAINFETKNAQQVGGYYTGIDPDETANDYVNIPWGNSSDENLSKIFSYIQTGNFRQAATEQRMASNPALRLNQPLSIPSGQFNGMVDYRK